MGYASSAFFVPVLFMPVLFMPVISADGAALLKGLLLALEGQFKHELV